MVREEKNHSCQCLEVLGVQAPTHRQASSTNTNLRKDWKGAAPTTPPGGVASVSWEQRRMKRGVERRGVKEDDRNLRL